jgi:DNA-binding SARP family transcriptional activator
MQRTRLAAQTSQTSQEDLAAYRAAHPDDPLPLVVLVAAPGHDHTPALHPILDQGRRLDVAGVLLGPWPSGATCTLDGSARVIDTTSPALAHLVGNHLFGLDPAETADVVQVLTAARDRPKPPPSFGHPPPMAQAATPAAPSKARLRVLGQVRLQIGLSDVRSKRRSTHEVLTYLAVHRQGATTEQITAALWPDDAHEQAAKRLYDAISSLRSVLRTELAALASDIVITTQGGYRLNPDLIEVDLWQFDQALAAARHAHDPGERMRHLQSAIALAAGPLADGRYEWADQPRDEQVRRTVEAMSRAAELVHHDPERALRILAPALTLDPYNEALYQQRMLIQVKSGQASAARATYAQLETRLREIDAAPDEHSEQILRTTETRPAPDHTPRPPRE